jgi:PAS domain S-box-containing protein
VDIWGFPPEVMAARDDQAAITWALDHVADPDTFSSAIRDLQSSFEGERLDVVEMRDGRRFERFSRPQRVGEQMVGRVWSYRDVTERERSRAELERSLSLLQATLESTADGIVVVGLDDRMAHWNRRFVEMWGLDPADLLHDQEHAVRQVGGQLVDPDGFLEAVRSLAVDPQAESLDVAHLRDGRVFECYSQPQRVGDRVVGRVWSYRDITERVRAEDALRASEERFRQIAENIHQVFYLVEVDEDRVSYVSPALRDIFGIEPEALMRERGVWLPLLHPDDRALFAGPRAALTRPREISYRIIRPDGELRWVRTRTVPVRDASGRVYREAGITEDVTDRVLAEEAVRASEARFREIAGTLHGVFYSAEVHPPRVTYVSPGYERVFGRDPAELLADVRAWLRYVHPDDRQQLGALMSRGGAPLDHTYRILMPDGRVRWLNTRGFPVQDEDGQVRRSVGVTEDVTDRVLAEQAVRASEARFREIADALHGVFYVVELEPFGVVYLSPAYERVFGRDPAELLADPRVWLRGVHPADREGVAAIMRARGEPVDHTYRIIRPDGQVRWVHTRGFPVQDEDGVVRRSVGITEDVTDSVLAEQAVRASEARFREIADALHGVFYVVELEPFGVVYLSPAFERVFGRAPDEVLADISAWFRYIHPDDRAEVAAQLSGKGEPAQVTYRIVLPGGEVRWLHTRGFPVRDEDGVVRRSAGITENVTDRVLAEQALAASEERFRQMAENIREVFFIQDVESGQMLYVSPAYEEVWGRSRAELAENPRAWLDALHPDDVPELWDIGDMRDVQESSYRIVRPDGEIRWIRSRGFPVADADGRVYRLAGLAEDVTEQVRADEALRAGEQRFRQIAENIREVFYIYDLDETRLLYVSPAYQGIWGRPTADVLRDPGAWLNGVHPDDAPALARSMGAGGGEYEAEYRVVRPDGEVRWIWGRGFPVLDDDGRVYREVGIAEDVTARKEAELAIRDAERRAQQTAARMRAIATAAAAVLGAESPGRLRELLEEVSRAVLDFDLLLLLLYDAEQNVFEDLGGSDAGVPVLPSRIPAPGTPALRVVAQRRTLVTHSSADPASAGARLAGTGRRTESAVRAPVLAGERVLGVFSVQSYQPSLYTDEDVEVVEALAALAATALENLRLSRERRAAEEALNESQRQLLHSQKMEAVGRLAGGIAHDFNNMLMAIGGHAELLRTEPAMPASCRWQADEIHKASERAAGLTRQLLAFSRKQVMQPRPLSVNAVITDMEDMLRRLIGETIRLRTSLSPGVGVVRADPGQLEQVLMNLVVNARDAMPGGGTVTLETGNVMLDGEYAGLHDEVIPGPYVMLAVADTGTGMDAAVRQRIFEPFFTTKPQGKGTGLGLSTVYGVVRQSGGHVWVYSELGKGTTFKIYLPREDAPHEPAESPALLPTLERGSETILLVEDDQVVRELLRMFLQRQGYRVLGAGSGGDALRVAESAGGPPDLLLTDVVMPGMSGRELAVQVRERWPGVAVIYMSGYTDDAIVHHGVLDPGSEFIQKPVSPDVLAHRIRAVLEAR